MSLNLVDLDSQLTNVRQLCRKAPLPTVRRAYTRALREWCQQTQWLRLTLPGVTEANTRTYSLGTDPVLDVIAIRAMSITDTFGNVQGLAATDSSQWDPNAPAQLPRRYCYLVEGSFALDPIPDQSYTLSVSVITTPKEVAAAALQIPSDPLVKYSNDIEAGALAYLYGMKGEPWADANAAAFNTRAFQAAISNGKAEVQRAYNTGSVRVRPRPFGVWWG